MKTIIIIRDIKQKIFKTHPSHLKQIKTTIIPVTENEITLASLAEISVHQARGRLECIHSIKEYRQFLEQQEHQAKILNTHTLPKSPFQSLEQIPTGVLSTTLPFSTLRRTASLAAHLTSYSSASTSGIHHSTPSACLNSDELKLF